MKSSSMFAAALAVATITGTAAAQFPARPVKIVVGFPPGSTPDLVTRTVAERMGAGLGQTVVVENRPGAGKHHRHRNSGPLDCGRLDPDRQRVQRRWDRLRVRDDRPCAVRPVRRLHAGRPSDAGPLGGGGVAVAWGGLARGTRRARQIAARRADVSFAGHRHIAASPGRAVPPARRDGRDPRALHGQPVPRSHRRPRVVRGAVFRCRGAAHQVRQAQGPRRALQPEACVAARRSDRRRSRSARPDLQRGRLHVCPGRHAERMWLRASTRGSTRPRRRTP